jgi:hypothetical protein
MKRARSDEIQQDNKRIREITNVHASYKCVALRRFGTLSTIRLMCPPSLTELQAVAYHLNATTISDDTGKIIDDVEQIKHNSVLYIK